MKRFSMILILVISTLVPAIAIAYIERTDNILSDKDIAIFMVGWEHINDGTITFRIKKNTLGGTVQVDVDTNSENYGQGYAAGSTTIDFN